MSNTENTSVSVAAETQDLRAAYVAPTVRVLFVEHTAVGFGSGLDLNNSTTSNAG